MSHMALLEEPPELAVRTRSQLQEDGSALVSAVRIPARRFAEPPALSGITEDEMAVETTPPMCSLETSLGVLSLRDKKARPPKFSLDTVKSVALREVTPPMDWSPSVSPGPEDDVPSQSSGSIAPTSRSSSPWSAYLRAKRQCGTAAESYTDEDFELPPTVAQRPLSAPPAIVRLLEGDEIHLPPALLQPVRPESERSSGASLLSGGGCSCPGGGPLIAMGASAWWTALQREEAALPQPRPFSAQDNLSEISEITPCTYSSPASLSPNPDDYPPSRASSSTSPAHRPDSPWTLYMRMKRHARLSDDVPAGTDDTVPQTRARPIARAPSAPPTLVRPAASRPRLRKGCSPVGGTAAIVGVSAHTLAPASRA